MFTFSTAYGKYTAYEIKDMQKICAPDQETKNLRWLHGLHFTSQNWYQNLKNLLGFVNTNTTICVSDTAYSSIGVVLEGDLQVLFDRHVHTKRSRYIALNEEYETIENLHLISNLNAIENRSQYDNRTEGWMVPRKVIGIWVSKEMASNEKIMEQVHQFTNNIIIVDVIDGNVKDQKEIYDWAQSIKA